MNVVKEKNTHACQHKTTTAIRYHFVFHLEVTIMVPCDYIFRYYGFISDRELGIANISYCILGDKVLVEKEESSKIITMELKPNDWYERIDVLKYFSAFYNMYKMLKSH